MNERTPYEREHELAEPSLAEQVWGWMMRIELVAHGMKDRSPDVLTTEHLEGASDREMGPLQRHNPDEILAINYEDRAGIDHGYTVLTVPYRTKDKRTEYWPAIQLEHGIATEGFQLTPQGEFLHYTDASEAAQLGDAMTARKMVAAFQLFHLLQTNRSHTFRIVQDETH